MTGLIPSSPVVWTVDNINVEDGVPWWKQAAQGRMDEWDGTLQWITLYREGKEEIKRRESECYIDEWVPNDMHIEAKI